MTEYRTAAQDLALAQRNLERAIERSAYFAADGLDLDLAKRWAEGIATHGALVVIALEKMAREAKCLEQAETMARVRGSVSATVSEERVSYDTGERVVLLVAQATWTRPTEDA